MMFSFLPVSFLLGVSRERGIKKFKSKWLNQMNNEFNYLKPELNVFIKK